MYWKVMVPTALGVFGLPSLTFGLFPILLRPAMASVAVFTTGLVFVIAMMAIVPAQLWVGRVGPHRAAPFGLILGTVGCGLGLVAFATDGWPILFPAAIAMGVASGISMTSGLRLVEWITVPADRGALTGAFYAAAYAGMTMPARRLDRGQADRLHVRAGGAHRPRCDRLDLAHPRDEWARRVAAGVGSGQSLTAIPSPVTVRDRVDRRLELVGQ